MSGNCLDGIRFMRRFKHFHTIYGLSFLLIMLGTSQPAFPQSQDLETFAEYLRSGSIEEKRDTLQALRRLATADASRMAAVALQDEAEIVRATAVGAVVYLPKQEAVSVLIPFLRARSTFIRKETALALGEIGDASAAIALIDSMRDDRKTEVRAAAAVALGRIGNIAAVAPLMGVLSKKPRNSKAFLRRSAARALGQIFEKSTDRPVSLATPNSFLPDALKSSLKTSDTKAANIEFGVSTSVLEKVLLDLNESRDTKREAAFALGAIGDERSSEILRRLSVSEDYYLAEICLEALQRISGS